MCLKRRIKASIFKVCAQIVVDFDNWALVVTEPGQIRRGRLRGFQACLHQGLAAHVSSPGLVRFLSPRGWSWVRGEYIVMYHVSRGQQAPVWNL